MSHHLLQELYSKKLGDGKLEILKDSNDVDRAVLNPVKVSSVLLALLHVQY